jgi:hypothetical protein
MPCPAKDSERTRRGGFARLRATARRSEIEACGLQDTRYQNRVGGFIWRGPPLGGRSIGGVFGRASGGGAALPGENPMGLSDPWRSSNRASALNSIQALPYQARPDSFNLPPAGSLKDQVDA